MNQKLEYRFIITVKMNELSPLMLIVNPAAGGYSTKREWPNILEHLKEHLGLSFNYCETAYPGHAISLAKEAITKGYRFLVAVGGDGTVNEVANGILSTRNTKTMLGVVATGGECCFADSLGISKDYYKAFSGLGSPKKRKIDVGAIRYMYQGQEKERYFVNHADIGFGAEATRRWSHISQKSGRRLALALRFAVAARSLLNHRNITLEIEIDGKTSQMRSCEIIVVNGRYYANKMLVAPSAKLDDGLLDIVVLNNVSKLELLSIVPRTYSGTYIRHPKVVTSLVKSVKIRSLERFYVEADGELIGEGPVSFTVLPAALTVAT